NPNLYVSELKASKQAIIVTAAVYKKMSRLAHRFSTGQRRVRRTSAPNILTGSNAQKVSHSGGDGGTCDPQLIKSLNRMTSEQQAKAAGGGGGGKEEANALSEEGSLQREMLKDPRFGSPLLCDALVMLLALVPLFCGFIGYFSDTKKDQSVGSGYHYGLALCGIFIFLLGLRSASLHLINGTDITEDRVLYILDKFGGSVWIPKVPEVLQVEAGGSLAQQPTTSAGLDETCKLMLDPMSSSVFLLGNPRQTGQSAGGQTSDSVKV
ncbi:hypothetical protein BOX15_Mlig004185g1, partial [Macrostomum lignano]